MARRMHCCLPTSEPRSWPRDDRRPSVPINDGYLPSEFRYFVFEVLCTWNASMAYTHTLEEDAMTLTADVDMDMGLATVPPWAWQPCEDVELQPQWMTEGTTVDEHLTTMATASGGSSYLSCSPYIVPPSQTASTGPPIANGVVMEQNVHESPPRQSLNRRSGYPNPPEKNARSAQISATEWATHRPAITELYHHRDWTLPRVMEEMAKRGFHAS